MSTLQTTGAAASQGEGQPAAPASHFGWPAHHVVRAAADLETPLVYAGHGRWYLDPTATLGQRTAPVVHRPAPRPAGRALHRRNPRQVHHVITVQLLPDGWTATCLSHGERAGGHQLLSKALAALGRAGGGPR